MRTLPRLLLPRRLCTTVVAVVTLVGVATAAHGDDLTNKRDQTRKQQQAVKAQLDLATASDAAVVSQLGHLDHEVASQSAKVETARQAEASALAMVADASRKLADTEARRATFRRELAARAVDAYVDPSRGGMMEMLHASTLGDLEARQALLDLVQSNTAGLVEGLRATRADQAAAVKTLTSVRKVAADRAKVESDQAASLQKTQAAEQATHAEYQKRITALLAESQELAAHEGQIEDLIRSRAAAAAQILATHPPPASSASSGSVAHGPASSYGLIWPIHGPVTSEFGPRWGGFHPGIDIAGPNGTPIAAAKAGVVVFAGPNDGYGNFVIIDHGGGVATAYAHQSRIAVSDGQTVSQGQIIGYEGSTGFSTGPHLHFEVRINGTPQNPRNYEVGSP